jgi:cytochrome c oxidase subunit II
MATTKPIGAGSAPHFRRILLVWAVLSVIGVALVVFALGPHMPPGRASAESSDQTTANILITALMTPIMLFIWVYFVYAIVVFRQRGAHVEDGPPIRGHMRIQTSWVVGTSVIVLFLALYGSYTLLATAQGAGGGQGASPLVKPSGKPLQVQVIGQQWTWTYRYPTLGGFESQQLALPAGQLVELHVTSLDVVHSFWAYQIGVKADAMPGMDDVAYVTAYHPGTFDIRCSEVCGLWHSQMTGVGLVLAPAAFAAWAKSTAQANAASTRVLPPYATSYFPDPQRRAG